MFVRGLMGSVSRICFAPDDGGSAGGGAPVVVPVVPASGDAGAAGGASGGGVADGGGAAPDATPPAAEPGKVPNLLGDAKAPETVEETPEAKTAREALELARANETPEEKTARETAEREAAEKLANETPEEKTAREKSEKTAATLKSYDKLTVPAEVAPDAKLLGDFKAVAAEHGLSTDAAQALVDTVAPELAAAIKAPYEMFATMVETWVSECQKDPEIGGANFEKNLGLAAQAIDQFGGPKLREAMGFTGAGCNPEFVRFCVRVGKQLAEPDFVPGRPAGDKEVPLSAKMYPTMAQGG